MTDGEKYYKKDWMSEEQWECYQMFTDLCGGFHHTSGEPKRSGNDGIEINERYHNWSTFDSSFLTRTVLMAHDRIIRFSISPSGPGLLKFYLHKRVNREGSFYERHPTIEQAIEDFRKSDIWVFLSKS